MGTATRETWVQVYPDRTEPGQPGQPKRRGCGRDLPEPMVLGPTRRIFTLVGTFVMDARVLGE